jgi:hypothetical protein
MRSGLPVTVDPFPARIRGWAATLWRHGGRRVTDTPAEREAESTWTRLRRRKVVQWGLVYVAGAWGFLQGLEYLSGPYDWPRQLQQLTTLALLIGLPVLEHSNNRPSLPSTNGRSMGAEIDNDRRFRMTGGWRSP